MSVFTSFETYAYNMSSTTDHVNMREVTDFLTGIGAVPLFPDQFFYNKDKYGASSSVAEFVLSEKETAMFIMRFG